MYSPKIREDYIPTLYRLAKLKGVPMTKLVNGIIKSYFDQLESSANELKAREKTKNLLGGKDGKQIKRRKKK